MNNEEYKIELLPRVDELSALSAKALKIAGGIIGENLLREDIYFWASTDRCISLISGIITMLQARNLTCAGALLRMQMDNCMRTYAAFIAQDKDAVISCMIYGNRIDKEKDTHGKRLSDGHLKDEISKIDPEFRQVYDQASGYVHLSDKAFYQTVASCDDNCIELYTGSKLLERHNAVLVELADAFIHFLNLHFKLLNAVVESKQRFDLAQNDCDKK